jgi:hypothetical protein
VLHRYADRLTEDNGIRVSDTTTSAVDPAKRVELEMALAKKSSKATRAAKTNGDQED